MTNEERWLRQFKTAVRINASDAELWNLVAVYGSNSARDGEDPDVLLSPLEAAQRVAKYLHEGENVLPYRFVRPQRVLDLQGCRRRRFGACADASAAIAAAVLMVGGECNACYERHPALDTYAHVRIDVDGTPVDAYPDASLDVPSCTATWRVTRGSVRWPADVDAKMRRLLGVPSLQAGAR